MPISEDRLDEFIRIYKEVHNQELCRLCARDAAERIMKAYKLLATPASDAKETDCDIMPTLPA